MHCNLSANKNLGQHFLNDDQVVNKILNIAGDITNYNILEIGAGTGVLSQALLKKTPISLTMIEKDKRFYDVLCMIHSDQTNCKVIIDNILKSNIKNLLHKPAICVANLPYNISTAIFMKLMHNVSIFDKLILMFQKEVAERITAKSSNKRGRLSIIADLICETSYELTIEPQSFVPPPKIMSAVISLTPRRKPLYHFNNIKDIDHTTAILFANRRKTLRNNLRNIMPNPELFLFNLNIDPQKRPENLTTQEICMINNVIHNKDSMISSAR